MDYEKKYKEALERAKQFSEKPYLEDSKGIVEYILPELKESEDETIRKALIEMVHDTTGDELWVDYGIHKEEALAWLEKHGEMDMESYKDAEDEKREFVGDGFIKCYANFQDFKEGETYWLEYVGNDNYNVRSDNLLGKTYHITPCQLYTIFKKQTWLEKQGEKKSIWHNEDEEPQRGKLILLIMQSGTPIVAEIIEPNHTFNHGERWAYIDDLLEKKGETFTKKDVDDAYLKGICDTKQELEKQGEQKPVECCADKLWTEFQKQVAYLMASSYNREYEYTKGYVEWATQSLSHRRREAADNTAGERRIPHSGLPGIY